MREEESIWFKPNENLPPIGKPVLADIVNKYGCKAHCYATFTEAGWQTLGDMGEYVVEKWRYFIEG